MDLECHANKHCKRWGFVRHAEFQPKFHTFRSPKEREGALAARGTSKYGFCQETCYFVLLAAPSRALLGNTPFQEAARGCHPQSSRQGSRSGLLGARLPVGTREAWSQCPWSQCQFWVVQDKKEGAGVQEHHTCLLLLAAARRGRGVCDHCVLKNRGGLREKTHRFHCL